MSNGDVESVETVWVQGDDGVERGGGVRALAPRHRVSPVAHRRDDARGGRTGAVTDCAKRRAVARHAGGDDERERTQRDGVSMHSVRSGGLSSQAGE